MSTINLFHTGDAYIFKHYFEREDVVEKLEDYGYSVNIVERGEIPDYTVVVDRYEKHADLLKKPVDVIEREFDPRFTSNHFTMGIRQRVVSI